MWGERGKEGANTGVRGKRDERAEAGVGRKERRESVDKGKREREEGQGTK